MNQTLEGYTSRFWRKYIDLVQSVQIYLREVVKTTTLEQDPPNHKIVQLFVVSACIPLA